MLKFLSKWKGVLGLSWQWQKEHSGIAEGGWKDRRNTKIYSVTKKAIQPHCTQCNSTWNGCS